MSIGIYRKINVDFYSNKLIYINAKQHDMVRFLEITCYDQGKKVFIDNMVNSAFIRCKKPDDNAVFNSCIITEDGTIIVELSEQMLALPGNVYADILVYDASEVLVSTMNFCINVIATPVDNSEIESSGEFKALNDLIIDAKKEYDYVIEESRKNADIAIENVEKSIAASEASAQSASESLASAENSANSAKEAFGHLENVKQLAERAAISESNAKTSEENAKASEKSAAANAEIILSKVEEAADSALLSESWAVGGTGTRDGEDTDNSKYYSEQAKLHRESVRTSSNIARSYAVGDIGYREGEETDNAKYYYEQSRILAGNLQAATLDEVNEYFGFTTETTE